MKRTHLISRLSLTVLLSSAVVVATGCRDTGDQANDSPANKAGGSSERGQVEATGDLNMARGPEISVTGCLTANIDGLSYALTPTDTTPTAAERSMQMPGRETVTYELVGNAEDFRRHANTVVSARGREDASARREGAMERTDEATQQPAAGSTGTPSVETKEEVEVNVRRLQVSNVVATGNVCPSFGVQSGGRATQAPAAGAATRPSGSQR